MQHENQLSSSPIDESPVRRDVARVSAQHGTANRTNEQLLESMDDMAQKEVELMDKLMKYIVGNKVNSMISIMLVQY